MKYLAFIVLFHSLNLMGQTHFMVQDQVKLEQEKLRAVVQVQILNQKEEIVSYGAGFFLSKTGYLLTSYHVLQPYLEDKKLLLKIHPKDFPRTLGEVELLACQDDRKIDLCLLKVNDYSPAAFLAPSKITFSLGHQGTFIGHCDGRDFRIVKGKLKEIYKDIYQFITAVKVLDEYRPDRNFKVEMVQLDTQHCGGDSGGPLFGQQGELWGVTQEWIEIKGSGEKFYLFISANEVADYFEKYKNNPPFKIPKDRLYVVDYKARLDKLKQLRQQAGKSGQEKIP
ncbi:MAG: hypothetical protein A2X86_18030 [Bdellovibrionales bacterium GWA2_49_15]|nr:MAG: hypothetical protein A2X86_18030 [Bdellovibrionales bacterium GWA2_49_15]HAZ11624.1 hypothetical protein [Bdellovibrionales bacterium]